MHPDGHGKDILPGNYVIKKHPKTGQERKVILEHALGYFWALKVHFIYSRGFADEVAFLWAGLPILTLSCSMILCSSIESPYVDRSSH